MVKNLNFKQYGAVLRCLLLLVMVAVLATVTPGSVSAQVPEFQISVTAEDGVPDQFTEDVKKAALYTEKFYQERYGINFENPVRIIITPDKKAYAEARMREGGESREKAERHAKFASGNSVGDKHVILLNLGHSKMATDDKKRVKTTCHELTHQIQSQLSNNRQSKAGYMWLSEGSANALAFRVMEMAGFSTVEEQREKWSEDLQDSPKLAKTNMLINEKNWTNQVEKKKNPYTVATSMTEFLINKCGSYDKIIDYFKLLKDNNREVAFEKAFGMSHEKFLKEFNKYYSEVRELEGIKD